MAMASHLGHLTSQLQGMLYQLAPPAQFTGEQGLCKTFIIDCSIHFELTPHAFPTNRSRTAFMISHLSGRAKAWASAEWPRSSPLCRSLTDFQATIKKNFRSGDNRLGKGARAE